MCSTTYKVSFDEITVFLNELLEDSKTEYIKYQDHLVALPNEHDLRNADRRLAIAKDAKDSYLRAHSRVIGAMAAMEYIINLHREKEDGYFQIVDAKEYVNARIVFQDPAEDDLPF